MFPTFLRALLLVCSVITVHLDATTRAQVTAAPGSAAQFAGCVGDCDGDDLVSITELITLVNLALGFPGDCAGLDSAGAGTVTISVLVTAVINALNDCNPPPPRSTNTPATRTPTRRPTRTATPTIRPTQTPQLPQSVCGGPVTSTPKLCNLTVTPSRVASGGLVVFSFGISDREGDLNKLCLTVSVDSSGFIVQSECGPPDPDVFPNNQFTNFVFQGPPGPANVPAGFVYRIELVANDRAGHVSNTVTTTVTVF